MTRLPQHEGEHMKKIVALFTLLAVLTACGGGGDRPSQDDIAKSLKDSDNPVSAMATGASDDQIDCIAKALHDSDLSDDALQALVDGDEDYKGDKDDEEALTGMADDFGKCITG
jgi:hypothetical protein